MPLFQYPAKVQPVSTLQESVTVDRWLPTCPQPARPLRLVTLGKTAALYAPAVVKPLPFSLVTFPEATTEDRWHATYRHPDRTRRYAAGTSMVGPLAPIVVVGGVAARRTLYGRAGARSVA